VTQALARVDRLFGSETRTLAHLSRNADGIRDLQIGALEHPDPHMRRSCLWALDHFANDVSMAVFASALDDDVHFVRDIALHSLACESCKIDEACAADVVTPLLRVLESDPKPDLRIKALSALLRYAGRDQRVRDAFAHAARVNSDAEVRRCAGEAMTGSFTPPKKRYDRSQSRRAAIGHGTFPSSWLPT
jgi:HEAT repeat protein